MSPEQHNKYLGLAHLGYAALHSLMGLVFGILMIFVFSSLPSTPRGANPPLGFFVVMGLFLMVFSIGWSIPSMIAAYGLLKKKKWAKIAGIVAGAFAATQMPVGTAISIYTFWFLFSPPGRLLYDQPAQSSLAGQQELAGMASAKQSEHHYVPPDSPPDWR